MKTNFYTGKGDAGKSFLGKKAFCKDDPAFDFLGDLDELNSWAGFCRASLKKGGKEIEKDILSVQELLFILQAETASIFLLGKRSKIKIGPEDAEFLEGVIKKIDNKVPRLDKFVVFGESELSAKLDLARAVCRRVERKAVKLSKKNKVSRQSLAFLNRLSSLFFAFARYTNQIERKKEKNPKYRRN